MTVEQPTTQAVTDSPDRAEFVTIPRQTLSQLVIAVLFFILGFASALVVTQINAASAQSTYQAALDDAVAAILDALPESGGVAQAAPQPSGPDPNRRYEASPDDDPYLGPEDAPITIIEFSDFRCPYCGRFAATTFDPLMEQYGDQIRFVYRDFPVLGDLSFKAAEAAECADEQGAFWPYHDLLFANQQSLTLDSFVSFAEQLELDVETFQSCLENETYRDEVLADFNAARDLGATGTPAFFINGRLVSGAQPLQVFQSVIDEELAAIEAGS